MQTDNIFIIANNTFAAQEEEEIYALIFFVSPEKN